jgi:NAD(P)-dependent dehydrogenase (short-subunit alcohol dehydrogenase family)
MITGANTGLGQAIALALANAGADIIPTADYVHTAIIPVVGGWLAR